MLVSIIFADIIPKKLLSHENVGIFFGHYLENVIEIN